MQEKVAGGDPAIRSWPNLQEQVDKDEQQAEEREQTRLFHQEAIETLDKLVDTLVHMWSIARELTLPLFVAGKQIVGKVGPQPFRQATQHVNAAFPVFLLLNLTAVIKQ